jgi:hypothetical protein
MKNLFFSTFFLLLSITLYSQKEETQSPYFAVIGRDSLFDALPLKSTSATVNISGVIADVMIEQTYTNEGLTALEAIYIFPGSTRAAVYGMQMQIGSRIIEAKIEEREKAKNIYTQAKNEGKRASLLEQHRPNVFQMNVANIMPGDTIKVRLKYTELLIPDEGVYQFYYPAVVGPRYINVKEESNTSFAKLPYQKQGQAPLYDFDIDVNLSTGVPLREIKSPSHHITINKLKENIATISIVPNEKNGDRAFVLIYSLKGNAIETGVLLYDDGDEKYFLCMVQPPKEIETNSIPPREYVFIVDVSGSMHGFPLEVAKKLMNDLILGLRPNDLFNILLFSGGNQILSDHSIPATKANMAKAVNFINSQNGGGGTELMGALRQGLSLPREAEGIARSIVVVTDGYVGVEPEAFEFVRHNLNKANLFAFGIGSDVNMHLIDGLAHAGQGLPAVILNEQEAPKAAEKFRQYISNPLYTQIYAQFDGFDAYDIEPLTIPDVLAERPVIIFGKWRGKPGGNIILTGYTGNPHAMLPIALSSSTSSTVIPAGKKTKITTSLEGISPDSNHGGLKYLWARERLRRLSDYNSVAENEIRTKEITRLGLNYNLLTAYTSFVAVDNEPVRAADGTFKTVKQPLPLPQGVSNYAVGFELNICGVTGMVQSSIFTMVWYLIFSAVCLMIVWFIFWRKRSALQGSLTAVIAVILVSGCNKNSSVAPVDDRCATGITEATFILGEDENEQNLYYTQASQYFHQQADFSKEIIVEDVRSLSALHHFLLKYVPADGAWDQINLVVHGNPWTGMGLQLSEEDPVRLNAEVLEEAFDEGMFDAFPPYVIDEQTHVVIYSCSIGQDIPLIGQLNKFFTNDEGVIASIQVSPHFNVFYADHKNNDRIEHMEAACFYVTYPLEKKPNQKEIADALYTKYPDLNIDWLKSLQRSNFDDKQPYAHNFHVPVDWMFLYTKEKEIPAFRWQDELRKWVLQQEDINHELTRMHLSPEDFWWTAQQSKYKISSFESQPALNIHGSTRVYCVLVPVV